MNYSEYKITLDIHAMSSPVSLNVKKGESGKQIHVTLREDGVPYGISSECYAVFSGKKPDGTKLWNSCVIEGDEIVYQITKQTTAVCGIVSCQIRLYGAGGKLICSPDFTLIVDANTVEDDEVVLVSENEVTALTELVSEATTLIDDVEAKLENGEFVGPQGPEGPQGVPGPQDVSGLLPAPGSAEVGQYLEVAAVDENGKITAMKAVESPSGGLDDNAATLLITILRNGVYSTDQSANITALETALGATGGEVAPDEPEVPDEPDEPVVVTYTITSALVNVESSNTSAIVNEGSNYTATLTPVDGYEIESVIVTMGGVDITATAYADGVVSIASVTGDVVITASAVEVDDRPNNGWVDGEAYAVEWIADTCFNNGTGEETANTGKSVSQFCPCFGASVVEVGANVYSPEAYGTYFYDADKNFMGRSFLPYKYDSRYAGVPHGAYFVRWIKVSSKTDDTSLTPRIIDSLNATTVAESKKVYVADWEFNKKLDVNTGALTDEEGVNTTQPMLVYGFSAINCQINARSWYAFYDADMAFISTKIKQNATSALGIPTNATYVRWTQANATSNPCFYLLDDVWAVDRTLTQTNATNFDGGGMANVTKGGSFTTTLTAKSGYVLSSVTVTMGGVDITNDVYADGVVTIPSVTSHVQITAVSVAEGA